MTYLPCSIERFYGLLRYLYAGFFFCSHCALYVTSGRIRGIFQRLWPRGSASSSACLSLLFHLLDLDANLGGLMGVILPRTVFNNLGIGAEIHCTGVLGVCGTDMA